MHLLLERRPGVDDDVGVALAQQLEDVLHVRPVMSSVDSGVGGASITLMPVECWTRIDSTTSESAVSNDPMRSAIVFAFGLMFRITAMSPNGRLPSTSTTGLFVIWWSATARFVAIVVRPTPPFGEKNVMILPVSPTRRRRGRCRRAGAGAAGATGA